MIIATPVTVDGRTAPRWGRAHWVGVADVTGPRIAAWTIHEVGWDDASSFGRDRRHARIGRFLTAAQVEAVVVPKVGSRMTKLLDRLGIAVLPASAADAKESVLAAVAARRAA
ncbi:MAG: NifB/NifX family molybdenum-iron cluster-binding protein [Propionicimonas sp.]